MPRCVPRLCVKLAWLVLMLLSPLIHPLPFYSFMAATIITATILLVFSGNGRYALVLLLGFGSMAMVVLLIDYASGTYSAETLRRLGYTVSSALLLAYIALSTRVSEAEALLGRNVVTQAMLFIHTLRAELVSIDEAMRARGHELRGPRSAVPLLIAFISCLMGRMEVLEDSLRARGAD